MFLKPKAAGYGSILTVFSGIVLLCVSSIIVIIIIIVVVITIIIKMIPMVMNKYSKK